MSEQPNRRSAISWPMAGRRVNSVLCGLSVAGFVTALYGRISLLAADLQASDEGRFTAVPNLILVVVAVSASIALLVASRPVWIWPVVWRITWIAELLVVVAVVDLLPRLDRIREDLIFLGAAAGPLRIEIGAVMVATAAAATLVARFLGRATLYRYGDRATGLTAAAAGASFLVIALVIGFAVGRASQFDDQYIKAGAATFEATPDASAAQRVGYRIPVSTNAQMEAAGSGFVVVQGLSMTAFDGATGESRWSRQFPRGGGLRTTGVGSGSVVIYAMDGETSAFDATTGEQLWHRFDPADVAAVGVGNVITTEQRGDDIAMSSLSPKTGAVMWSRVIQANSSSSCGIRVALGPEYLWAAQRCGSLTLVYRDLKSGETTSATQLGTRDGLMSEFYPTSAGVVFNFSPSEDAPDETLLQPIAGGSFATLTNDKSGGGRALAATKDGHVLVGDRGRLQIIDSKSGARTAVADSRDGLSPHEKVSAVSGGFATGDLEFAANLDSPKTLSIIDQTSGELTTRPGECVSPRYRQSALSVPGALLVRCITDDSRPGQILGFKS